MFRFAKCSERAAVCSSFDRTMFKTGMPIEAFFPLPRLDARLSCRKHN